MKMGCSSSLFFLLFGSLGAAELVVQTAGEDGTCALYNYQISCWGFWTKMAPKVLDLGQDFYPIDLSCGSYHCCAWNAESGNMKCFGWNTAGQLGYNKGSTEYQVVFWESDDNMGDDLQFVDLAQYDNFGANFQLRDVVASGEDTCAMSTDGNVWCFGRGGGDEMENAPLIAFEDDTFVPVKFGRGGRFCVISDDGRVKCWGTSNSFLNVYDPCNGFPDDDDFYAVDFLVNPNAHCALTDQNVVQCCGTWFGWGGDYTFNGINVMFGTDFVVKEFSLGGWSGSVCGLSTEGAIRCVGDNAFGMLGYESNDRLIAYDVDTNAKADQLPFVAIGSDFHPAEVHLSRTSPSQHFCVSEERVDALLVQCWGSNNYQQLGFDSGDNNQNIGDAADEMGDNLHFVALGFQLPTADPTVDPTADPTTDPTVVPTTVPTSNPTTVPTSNPTTVSGTLSWHGWGGRNLNECEGDCDNDDHCAAGLYCYHDAGVNMNGPPPGCTGTAFTEKADYCFKVPASTGELVWFSWYQTGGLNACQGDCDNDDDCSGDLECYHNAGKKGVDVPGCTGTPTVTSGGEDYCYDPNYELGVAAAAGFASGHSDDEPAEDMEPDHAASGEEALNLNDLIMMMVGAAIGVMVVAGLAVLVISIKRKRSGKKEETEMAKAVHVPETSPASVDGVETI